MAIPQPGATRATQATALTLLLASFALAADSSQKCDGTAVRPCRVSQVLDPRTFDGGHISDSAGILDSATTHMLTSMARAIEQNMTTQLNATGLQLLIVTVDTVADLCPGNGCTIDPRNPQPLAAQMSREFAHHLFHYLFHCATCADSLGVLVMVFTGLRRVEIVVGPSLNSSLCGLWSAPMLEHDVVPLFRAGRYSDAIVECVRRVAARLTETGGDPSHPHPFYIYSPCRAPLPPYSAKELAAARAAASQEFTWYAISMGLIPIGLLIAIVFTGICCPHAMAPTSEGRGGYDEHMYRDYSSYSCGGGWGGGGGGFSSGGGGASW